MPKLPLISSWPVLRQLCARDVGGLGATAASQRTQGLQPRTRSADRVVRSVCPYCAVGCGQLVYVKDEKIIDIEGDPDSPVSQGCLCPKGAATFQLVTGSHRQEHVLYRRPGGTAWERIPLERAVDMGLVARGAEFALSNALHREAGVVPRVEVALRRGRGGLLLTAARVGLLAASVLDILPGSRSRGRRRVIGALGILGTLAMRFGVVAAGRASARDPRATFEMQRAGRGAAEVAKERRHPMPAPPGVDVGGRESYAHGAGAASP